MGFKLKPKLCCCNKYSTMTRIFIENFELDIDKSITQQLNYAVDDIINIDSKSTSFSRTIVLPGTTNNNYLLGNIFEFNNANFTNDTEPNVKYNFNASKSAKCRIESNGMLLMKGVFRLLEIIHDKGRIEYEAVMFGELGGFVSRLGASKLQDLDFSAYDHEYSIANITGSWANDNAGAGYYYPLIDYGNYSSAKKNWKVGTFRPAIFLKEVIEKIVDGAGYTMDFPLLDTDRFNRLGIPYNRKVLTANNTLILSKATDEHTVSDATIELVEFDAAGGTLGAFTSADNITFTYSPPVTTTSILTTIDFNINIISYDADPDTVTVSLRKNGIAIGSVTGFSGAYNIHLTNISFSNTDTFDVRITSIATGSTIVYTADVRIDSAVAIPTAVLIGDDVKMNDALPQNILQKDLFTSVLKLFNLYVDEDRNNEKHLIIKPYTDYYTGDIVDLSDYVDRGKPIRIKPMSELNARYYNFKFKDDSDYYNDLYKKRYNEGYGSRIFDSVFEFASETKNLELIFASTPLVGYSGEEKIYSTIFKRTGNDSSVTEEQVDSVIRLMQFNTLTTTLSWKIRNTDDNADLHSGTDWPYAGHLDDPITPTNDLNFGAPKELFFTLNGGSLSTNQFNVYYSPYMAEITDKDSRLLTCYMWLNDLQMFNMDFAKYVYVDGGLYRLNKITDYTPNSNESVKVELLRVINTEY